MISRPQPSTSGSIARNPSRRDAVGSRSSWQFYDWLLFFHVASAFALVAALVTFWSIAIAARNVDRPADSVRYFKIARPANILIVVGTMGTLIFGIWLAIDASAYQAWDGWVLIALALWFVAAGTGQRGGQTYAEAAKLGSELDGRGGATSRARSFASSSRTGAPCG